MTADTPKIVRCPGCGKGYRWRDELAGKKIRCKDCDETFAVDGPGEGVDDELAEAAKRGGHVPPRRRAAGDADNFDPDAPTAFHNWVVPGVALGLGLLWRGYQTFSHAAQYESVALWQSLGLVLLEWALLTAAVFGAVALTTAITSLEIGDLASAILKAAAAALLMAAACRFFSGIDRDPGDTNGFLFGVPAVLLIGFVMFVACYRADLAESLMAAVAMTFLCVGVLAVLGANIGGEAGAVLGLGRSVGLR